MTRALKVERAASDGLRGRGRPRITGLPQKIIASATRLFGERSFAEVSIEEIALSAGVGKGSIYREFGAKEALYATTIITGLDQLLTRMNAMLGSVPRGTEAIKTLIREATLYFWDHGEFFALLRDPTALPASQLVSFGRERAKLALLIAKVLEEGVAAGVFRDDLNCALVAEAVLGMIRGLRRHRAKEITVAEAITTIEQLLLEGYLAQTDRLVRATQHPTDMRPR